TVSARQVRTTVLSGTPSTRPIHERCPHLSVSTRSPTATSATSSNRLRTSEVDGAAVSASTPAAASSRMSIATVRDRTTAGEAPSAWAPRAPGIWVPGTCEKSGCAAPSLVLKSSASATPTPTQRRVLWNVNRHLVRGGGGDGGRAVVTAADADVVPARRGERLKRCCAAAGVHLEHIREARLRPDDDVVGGGQVGTRGRRPREGDDIPRIECEAEARRRVGRRGAGKDAHEHVGRRRARRARVP